MDLKEKKAIENLTEIIILAKEEKDITAILDKIDIESIETILEENKKKDKMIDKLVSFIEVFELDKEILKIYCKNNKCEHKNENDCQKCIRKYFEKEDNYEM